ncbi:MAG: lytic transglycosylase domain-containing protein [Melioribacteraceae bacterium]|nr:lytic transglycosylase domain-containing protein [Melioribacteraceae bacterium]MCF8355243.1 lytic transglycosylase domain-containing protein [Melioribacteraceae bacterium]MCF8395230.1 lytic transglycosylase domain-containing protein [Melioribacteraceae bacterium]MCF8420704.1 lytic transglycosylase domain-containing protein [Melioribacteraceae bacterium]
MKKKSKVVFTYLFISAAVIVGILNIAMFSTAEETKPIQDEHYPQAYKIISPEIPEELDFCGEKVPLNDFDVYERIEREFIANTYWHSSTILFFKRANRWFPVIEPILKKNGIPDDFKYVSLIESNLSNAISPAGAVGFWQFLRSTGREYNLEIYEEIDERYNVELATEAACAYIIESYQKFGSWTLAAASYNMGVDGVQKQLERQKSNYYYNLLLNEETSRYVMRILAAKTILSNPKKYGFHLSEQDLYPPYQTYDLKVDYSITDLAEFAKGKGINYKILKIFNPWLRDNYLKNPTKKEYVFKLPVEGTIEFVRE